MRHHARTLLAAGLVLLFIAAARAQAPAGVDRAALGKVELVRDTWGVAHVLAETDAGAMYGLGYACVQDRAFQMHYSLRIIQGRAAEVLGDRQTNRRNEGAIFSDRKMRTFGFYRAAQAAASNLDTDSRAMLEAYCAGVNDAMTAEKERLHPLFAEIGLSPEPWTPADCLASFWHLGQFFATDGTRELLHYRTLQAPPQQGVARDGRVVAPPKPGAMWVDDDAAVVQKSDVDQGWIDRVNEFVKLKGLAPGDQPGSEEGRKFSHAWVVGGSKTTTGSAVLVSDPQTPVRAPSIWQEFHVHGKTFNARGVGVSGCPGLLIGWNENVAWGATAVGADQADLFRLKTDAEHPNQYQVDGQWRDMRVRRETILVKGGTPVQLEVRETMFGPIITPFAFAAPGDPEVALKRVPVSSQDPGTIRAMLAMMRSSDAKSFAQATSTWQFPSINLIFGDKAGTIGFWVLAAVPVRGALDGDRGTAAMDGSRSDMDWQGFIPHELMPHVVNPARGWIASANHRPIGSFYPAPLGLGTGSGGHTTRSWRLYERLTAKDRFAPADVLDIHHDSVNAARREIVRAGLHLRDTLKRDLSGDARLALASLEGWFARGAKSDLSEPGGGAAIAGEISTFFRIVATPLAGTFGGGETGLSRFLRGVQDRIAKDPKAELTTDEQAYFDEVLATAWQSANSKYGEDPSAWNERARGNVTSGRIGTFESLDGFGSLSPRTDLRTPALSNVDGGTIRSQGAQSYTHYVTLHNVDESQSLLPPGQSELTDSPARTASMALWQKGELHPAPLTRAGVEKIAVSRTTLLPKQP